MGTLGILMTILSAMSKATANVLNRFFKEAHHAVIMFYAGVVGIVGAGTYIIIEAS